MEDDAETREEWRKLREWCAKRLDDECEGTADWPFALPTLPLPEGREVPESSSPRPPLPLDSARERRRERRSRTRRQKGTVALVGGALVLGGVLAFLLSSKRGEK